MNNEFNVKAFVDEYLKRIINMKDKAFHYQELKNIRESIIKQYDLNINDIDKKQISEYLKQSDYLDLFENIDIDEASNVIFLEKIESNEIIEIFDSMTKDINEKNYLRKIYSQNEVFQDEYGINLSDLEKFFNNCKYHLKFEIMGNMATFIEAYYSTEDGKKFIESYQNLKDDETKKDQYFRTIFDKKNDASIRKIFHTNNEGDITYSAAGAGTLDGFFILFDKNNNLTFNVSTTSSPDVKIEGTSILRHAITSKIISEAIVEEIDRQIFENKDHNPYYHDNKDNLKKMRSHYWEHVLKSDKGYVNEVKNTLIANAIIAKINETNLFKIDKDLLNENSLKSGKTIDDLVKKLNAENPVNTINKKLGTDSIITKSKVRAFFDTKKEDGFQTNFISEVKGVRNTKKFEASGLKAIFDKAKININEFKTFLQNAALKEVTLEAYSGSIEKEAIDFFYDNVITRRVFATASQIKINLQNFAMSAERLFSNVFVLNDDKKIDKYLRCLNGLDYSNIRSHLNYTIQKGAKIAEDKNIAPALHIQEKLDDLRIKSNATYFLSKISHKYNLVLADFLQSANSNFEAKKREREMFREMLADAGLNMSDEQFEAQIAAREAKNAQLSNQQSLKTKNKLK